MIAFGFVEAGRPVEVDVALGRSAGPLYVGPVWRTDLARPDLITKEVIDQSECPAREPLRGP